MKTTIDRQFYDQEEAILHTSVNDINLWNIAHEINTDFNSNFSRINGVQTSVQSPL